MEIFVIAIFMAIVGLVASYLTYWMVVNRYHHEATMQTQRIRDLEYELEDAHATIEALNMVVSGKAEASSLMRYTVVYIDPTTNERNVEQHQNIITAMAAAKQFARNNWTVKFAAHRIGGQSIEMQVL